ncbi:DUF3784 domain-containing protein [Macrococcoides canis]|uniref:DUF3784 domain-containing protein n=1 Tax=Macrococcoides canis TaxID=1855823 RepID=UPI001F39DC6F|nr:DUF3784 domain-containing protein [Macrococcus canis]UJS27860.1 DUF3784 domain-containing protein [Macrococcus canis]
MPIEPTLITVFILLIPAILFSFGKGAKLISGYSLMNESQKSTVNEKKLTRDMAIFLYMLIALIFIWHVAYKYGFDGVGLTLIGIIIVLVFIINSVLIFVNRK